MINFVVALLVGAFAAQSNTQFRPAFEGNPPAPQTPAKGGEPIKRGAPLGSAPVVSIASVLKDPQSFSNRKITLEGVIQRCCQRKGCWMEIAARARAKGLRVTFKDYGFFVPTTSAGMAVRAEGRVVIKILSKADVEHMRSEGAQVEPSADGTATEIGFEADGVELRKR